MGTLIESPVPVKWYMVEDGHPPSGQEVILWFDENWHIGSWWDHDGVYMAYGDHESYDPVKPTHWMDPGTPNA